MTDAHDYARFFRDAPVGIFRSTLDGRLVDANPALVSLLGYGSREDLLAVDLAEDIYADPTEREALIDAAGTDAYTGVEAEWLRADGQTIVVRLSGCPVEDDDGELVGFENFVEDVTGRHSTEKALDRVLRSSGAILFRLSPNPDGSWRGEWVSESVEDVLGYTTSETLRPGWWPDNLHPEDREGAFEASGRIVDDGQVVHEYRFRRKDGTYRWFRDEGHLLRDSRGEPDEVVGVWTDITSEKERLAELRRSEERFRGLAEVAPDGIVALDQAGRIVFSNPTAVEMFGYRVGELVGEPFTVLFPERFRDVNRRTFQSMLQSGVMTHTRPRTLVGRRKDGSEFPGEVAFAVDPEREGLAVTAVIRDITRRLELEAERSLLTSGHGVLTDRTGRTRGIIPVCSNCKSIKDGDGAWHPMEEYVRKRAPVEFSHGFCDDCVEKLYGSLD